MLIDTSGFLCVFHKDEPDHVKAVELYQRTDFHLTHNYVLAEFVPLAQVRGLPREMSLRFSESILSGHHIEVVWVDETLHRHAVRLLQERRDKNYSLCDAVSFVLMRERHLNEALSTDKHFEQEGFVRLLK